MQVCATTMLRTVTTSVAAAWVLAACNTGGQDGTAAGGEPGVVTPVIHCRALADFDLRPALGVEANIVSAESVVYEGVEACAVDGMIEPAIGFRVVLPTTTWRQRYLQTGCGGLCGRVSLRVGAADGCAPLVGGEFAIASTDMGHQGNGGAFGEDPQKRIDFAYRGVHLTAVASKALIAEYYGQTAAYSYFTGCSDGGREALIEAQRYPEDFDGIIAGAPAMNFSVQNSFYHAWQARSNTGADGQPILRAEHLPTLNEAVIAACDGLDGLEDGLITDPRACVFDPGVLLCDGTAQSAACLSAAEVEAARKLYGGPRDAESGLPLTLGGPQPGSELSWPGVFVPRPGEDRIFSTVIATDALGYLIYDKNPQQPYSIDSLRFDAAAFDEIRPLNGLYSGANPDIGAFIDSGGRLMLWHGWSDQHISPINTIAWYETAESLAGAARSVSALRLYLLPGMYHCGGGSGPSRFDMLTPMMAWVEQGIAPGAIVAGQPDEEAGSIVRSRPVYPYPDVAAYKGSGSPDDAGSFEPREGNRGPDRYAWLGEDFLAPGSQLDCRVESGALACVPAGD